MNRNPKTNCGSCLYFQPNNSEKLPGECRRNAPTPKYWTTVAKTDWCGEYQPDLYVTYPETDHALEFKAAMMSPSPFWPPVPEEPKE